MNLLDLFAIALLNLPSSPYGSETFFLREEHTTSHDACAIKLDVVKAVINSRLSDNSGSIVVDDAPDLKEFNPSSITESLRSVDAGSAVWRLGWRGSAPPTALVKQFYSKKNSLQNCLTVGGVSPFPTYKIISSASASPIFLRQVRITLPVISENKRNALVGYSRINENGGNGSELLLLHKSKEGWTVSGYRVLSVS